MFLNYLKNSIWALRIIETHKKGHQVRGLITLIKFYRFTHHVADKRAFFITFYWSLLLSFLLVIKKPRFQMNISEYLKHNQNIYKIFDNPIQFDHL
jgi:hypothetical protein